MGFRGLGKGVYRLLGLKGLVLNFKLLRRTVQKYTVSTFIDMVVMIVLITTTVMSILPCYESSDSVVQSVELQVV